METVRTHYPEASTNSCQVIEVDAQKAEHLKQLACLSMETLSLLAELSRRPGVEAKLKQKAGLIKTFL